MTDADTPRVPDFRWAPVPQWLGAVYVQSQERWYELAVKPDPVEPPADAVKLGDVEGIRAELEESKVVRRIHVDHIRQRNAEMRKLRADIRAVLDQLDAQRDNPQIRSRMQDGSNAPLHRAFEAGVRYAVGCLRRILDREPGREEPSDPRVFFPGDTVPAEIEVWTKDRAVYRWGTDRQLLPYEGAMVEVLYPSPAEWQAIVDRARAARGHVVEHQPDTEEPK